MPRATGRLEGKINVLYDGAMLGIGHKYNKTFGLFRTAHLLLVHLLEQSDLRLSASCALSFEAWSNCRDWLRRLPRDANLEWVGGDGLNNLRYAAYRMSKNALAKLQTTGLVKDKARALHVLRDFVGTGFQGLTPSQLSDIDVYHSPYHYIPGVVKQNRRIKTVLTIHDVIPFLYPHYCGITRELINTIPEHAEFGLHSALRSVDRDTWITCPSHATRNDVIEHLGSKVNPDQVVVTPWAASDAFYPCSDPQTFENIRRRYGLPEGRYLLSVCALEPRKNLNHVIRCFKKLVKQESLSDLYLVLAGAPGWEYESIFAEAYQDPVVKQKCVFTGYVDEADLACLYSNALAFVFMSLYEGFGLPPLEAMQCGCPTITSNTSSLPEVVGDAGIVIDPTDEDRLCEKLLDLYNSPGLRSELTRRSLDRAEKFSWRSCADQTVSVYRRALS
jgi:glycosyltransferase involved in cell wall biosynthesis